MYIAVIITGIVFMLMSIAPLLLPQDTQGQL